jgi:hypothetical protein
MVTTNRQESEMAGWRKDWQDFKKKYPKFEQSKDFKSDVGPQMDDFQDAKDKLYDVMKTATAEITKATGDLEKIKRSLEGAVGGYRRIVKDLIPSERSIERDFDSCFCQANSLLGDLNGVSGKVMEFAGKANALHFDPT